MKNRNVPIFLSVVLTWPIIVQAQVTNGLITVTQETIAAGGGRAGSGNPMSAVTVIGEPMGGAAVNGTFTVYSSSQATLKPPTGGSRLITIQGTINDSTALVVVNGVQATISQGTFRADGIRLVEGPNLVTATATDAAGNRASHSVTLHLHTVPPARPTVATTPAVTTATSYVLTGTKTPGTSVWINGSQVVPLDTTTTWTATVSLQEGDNVFTIVTKDAVGNESASQTVNIVVDNLPPVITVTAPGKTNFTPLVLTGTVDDSLTSVVANGVVASRSGRNFTVSLPLAQGLNTISVTATSPNSFVSTKTLPVTLGTIPTILTTQPADTSKLYAGTSVTISATATDKENDPIEFQIFLDGLLVVDWAAGAMFPWTPAEAQRGLHTIEVRARDGFGGSASKQAGVYVLRKPVPPP